MKDFWRNITDKVKKNKYIILAFTVLWIATVIFSLNYYRTSLGMETSGMIDASHVRELYEGTKIEQTLPVIDGAEGFCIRFATYARSNAGTVHIKVVGEDSHTVYAEHDYAAADIHDNQFLTIGFDTPLAEDRDSSIIVEFTSDSRRGESIGVYYTDSDVFEDGVMYENGISRNSDLTCKLLIPNSYYERFTRIVLTWTITCFTLLILLLALDVKEEIRFALTALLIGFTFMVIITPMSVPDEQYHYEAAYQITSVLFGEDHTIMDRAYRNYSHFLGHENSALAYLRLMQQFNEPLELKNKFETVAVDIDEMRYLGYFLPQSVGVFIGRLFKMNFLKTFYLGRFTNLLFFSGCVYLAIRKTPVLKTLFGLICCLPMFMQQYSSYSYDGFINGLIMVLLAYFLKWYFSEERISRREIFFVFLVTLLLAPSKFVYGLFVVPFVFVSADRFGGKKQKIIALLIVCLPVIYVFGDMLIPQFLRLLNRIKDTYGEEAAVASEVRTAGLSLKVEPEAFTDDFDPTGIPHEIYTIGFIVEYPIHALLMILKTIRYHLKRWFYDALGMTLSGETMLLPVRIIHIISILLILASLVREDHVISIWVKVTAIAICVIIGLMIVLGFLLSETYKTDEMVRGVQGRYFSPLLPYFFMIFNNRKPALPKQSGRYLVFVYLLVLFEIILYVLSFTFVNC